MPTGDADQEAAVSAALLLGAAETGVGLCLCDAGDLIRYSNPAFSAAFFPGFDGRPADFAGVLGAAIAAGAGLRLLSSAPDDFMRTIRRKRREMTGSRSFLADTTDGGWWTVTDTKLSSGWILAVAQDISGLKREEARLRDAHEAALAEAQTDFLTGAPNRRHGLRRAGALWAEARAAGRRFSIALMDVDHFKAINDVYGHEAGDRALVHLAGALMASASPDDAFARLGGDEFLLARPGAGRLDAAMAATLAALPPIVLGRGDAPLRLSISVGVAEARPDDTWPALMHRADMALYDAKAQGRDRIALAG